MKVGDRVKWIGERNKQLEGLLAEIFPKTDDLPEATAVYCDTVNGRKLPKVQTYFPKPNELEVV